MALSPILTLLWVRGPLEPMASPALKVGVNFLETRMTMLKTAILIDTMIHNVYNMYTNYSVHASHTTCMHLWHLPNTTYHPSLISTASALDGSVGFISTWSTLSGSTSVPRLIMERKLEKHPAAVFWHSKWCPVQT